MNNELDPQNSEHELARLDYSELEEQKFMDEAGEIREADDARMYPGEENEAGWPGDGSGMDDLADFNQNEAFDYGNE